MAAVQTSNTPASTDKVSVGCKMPNGVHLRTFVMAERDEPVMGGGTKTVKFAQHTGESVHLHGTATPFGRAPKCLIVGGYAITPDVSADFMSRWMKDNADSDLVKNGVVIVQPTAARVESEAGEKQAVTSGLEPIDPENPGRGVKGVTKADVK